MPKNDYLRIKLSYFSNEDALIHHWNSHIEDCSHHPLYLQMRQEFFLNCVLKNSNSTISKVILELLNESNYRTTFVEV